MRFANRIVAVLFAGLLSALVVGAAEKETYGTLKTALNVTALQPGKKAVIAVVFDVKSGYHAQSHTPSSPDYVQFDVKLDDNSAITASDPVYPAGEDHNYAEIGKLNVYTGKAIIYIPVQVKADAPKGEIKLTGSAHYQACDDKVCYMPMTLEFELPAKIVAAGEAVSANEPELFKGYREGDKGATTKPAAGAKTSAEDLKKKSLGWGDWFQKPWFVWPVTAILVLMGLGMFGLFTFRLPLGVYTIDPRHDTYIGNFLFGILTAVLSTPCTAPLFPGLLAWAVLQARSGGRFVGIGVITMVGVGMALPYLLLSAFPELARRLPRTGPWSELVKQLMGFLIFGVAAYFAGQQILPGNEFMWAVFVVAIAAGIFLIVRTVQLMPRPRPVIIALVLAVGMGYGTFALARSLNRPASVAWEHYSDEALAAARAQKKMTLVKFTAKWCANCQFVEATVFNDPPALAALRNHDVTMLKADLTKSDAPGAELLGELNPGGGIPLTAVYSPLREQPYILKSVYRTPSLVSALDAAAKGKPWEERSEKDMSALVAFSIALLVGVIFNVMPCVLPVLPLKAIGFYEVSQHNRAKSLTFGLVFSLGIIATFAVLALLVLPLAGAGAA
jgi:thiol:disulfide interchange protein DsbD